MIPAGILELTGITDMEERVAVVTVSVMLPEMGPEIAAMVVEPALAPVARPVLLTVATMGLDEFQVTCVVKSRLVPSEYVPVAVNCWVTPTGMDGLPGVTTMETRLTAGVLLLPPQAGRRPAKDPRNSIPRNNLKFFMKGLHLFRRGSLYSKGGTRPR